MIEEVRSQSFVLDPRRMARATYLPLIKPKIAPLVLLIFGVDLAMIYGAHVSALITLAATAVATPLASLNAYNRYAAGFRKAANRSLFLPKTITFTGDELRQESTDGSISVVKLSNVHKVDRMGEFTLVYITDAMAFFIPDGVWATTDDESKFKELMTNAVKDKSIPDIVST